MMDYQRTANQIDSIGDELKKIGNSVSNMGRLLAGKGTKEVSDEKPDRMSERFDAGKEA